MSETQRARLQQEIDSALGRWDPARAWAHVSQLVLNQEYSFDAHRRAWEIALAGWNEAQGPKPAWIPSEEVIERANVTALRRRLSLPDYAGLHQWSARNREAFWEMAVQQLGIHFRRSPARIMDSSEGVESPCWLSGAQLNIVESCFRAAPHAPAIVSGTSAGKVSTWSYQQLRELCNRVSNGLLRLALRPGDAVAVILPMTPEAIAIYLGIIQAGCVAISIADSFAAPEIARRLETGRAAAVFTYSHILREGKRLPLMERIIAAKAPRCVVLDHEQGTPLRGGDVRWEDFLPDNASFDALPAAPHDAINILFSSGTTGEPKAIVWDHTTAIKCAADAFHHHDLHTGDVVAWPTNLGWMMGPWLIFATLINRGTIAVYSDAPFGREFGRFVQDAGVNVLGLVPSIVRRWRETCCMEGLDWSRLRAFSSTGECSNREDMFYVMYLAGYRPIIEYCGGTEIGGGYITGTVVQPNAPSTFSTPALGLDFVILDEDGRPADTGEVFLLPPSIGLSRRLLNRDHHEVYFAGAPAGPAGQILRRHGDQMMRLPGGYYRALGRADDTMKLGGIKVSSAEVEQSLNRLPAVSETAAVAVSPMGGGPAQLVVYVVPKGDQPPGAAELQTQMQQAIRRELNPLFKISDVRIVPALPRTASNKIMRRELRAEYERSQVGRE
jgi:acetyl-CoA synthetase